MVIVHQDGLLVYGNRAGVKLFKAELDVGLLRPTGHQLRPSRRHQRHDRAAGPADGAGPVLRARRGPGHRPRRHDDRDGAHQHPHHVGQASRPTRRSCAMCPSVGPPRRPPATGPAWWPTCRTPSSVSTPTAASRAGTRPPRSSTAGPRTRWPASPSARSSPATAPTAPALLERGQRSHHRKDGSTVEVLVSIDPLVDDDTLPSGWVVVITELTDARQAEAGRRAAEERYEAVVASLSEGIILFDEDRTDERPQPGGAESILGDRLTEGDGHRLFTGASIATTADGFPLTPTMFPHVKTLATGESEDGVIIGVTDERGTTPVAVGELPAAVGREPRRRPHGRLLVHRRDRPAGRRGAAAVARLSRLAHRARQPLVLQRRARARAAPVDAERHQPGRALHRPRPLQVGQRLLRPRRGRRTAAQAGPPVQGGGCAGATG